MDTIFDIGMFDGSDTAYYLETGHRVVAVEANPSLVELARQRFAPAIAAGQLICVHAAISADGGPVELMLAGSDLGSSSLFADKVARKRPAGAIEVPGISIAELVRQHGIPKYLKVDIEGADRYCVLALDAATRPPYLSFEIGEDVNELLDHCASLGYGRFKIIHQNSFREASRVECLTDRHRPSHHARPRLRRANNDPPRRPLLPRRPQLRPGPVAQRRRVAHARLDPRAPPRPQTPGLVRHPRVVCALTVSVQRSADLVV
jgi:FkbM family methyltransferase